MEYCIDKFLFVVFVPSALKLLSAGWIASSLSLVLCNRWHIFVVAKAFNCSSQCLLKGKVKKLTSTFIKNIP
jgi:hypothetical protein